MTTNWFPPATANAQYLLEPLFLSTPDGGWNDLARLMDDTFRLENVVWSPDGQYLAFIGEGGKIVIMRADGSKQVTVPVMASQFA